MEIMQSLLTELFDVLLSFAQLWIVFVDRSMEK